MKYIVDAQLPKRLQRWLTDFGVEAMHTLDLPNKNNTPDEEIVRLSESGESIIIVSKDKDFIQFRIVKGSPERLLIVSTGNIINNRLIELFELNFPKIDSYFKEGKKVIEIDNESVIIHE